MTEKEGGKINTINSTDKAQIARTNNNPNPHKLSWYINAEAKYHKGDANSVIVKGKTNLPDDTVLVISWDRDDALPELGRPEVKNGEFLLESSPWIDKPGEYQIYLWVFPNAQQDGVNKILGKSGESFEQRGFSTGEIRRVTLPPFWQYILVQKVKLLIP